MSSIVKCMQCFAGINRNNSSMNGMNNKCNRKNIYMYMYIGLSKLVFFVN